MKLPSNANGSFFGLIFTITPLHHVLARMKRKSRRNSNVFFRTNYAREREAKLLDKTEDLKNVTQMWVNYHNFMSSDLLQEFINITSRSYRYLLIAIIQLIFFSLSRLEISVEVRLRFESFTWYARKLYKRLKSPRSDFDDVLLSWAEPEVFEKSLQLSRNSIPLICSFFYSQNNLFICFYWLFPRETSRYKWGCDRNASLLVIFGFVLTDQTN